MIITLEETLLVARELRLHNEEYSHRTDESVILHLEYKAAKWEGKRRIKIMMITCAYEQGYGHALRVELNNPYLPGSDEHVAWDEGRRIGRLVAQRAQRNSGNTL